MSPRPILKHHLDIPTPEPLEPFPFAACPSVLLTTRHVHFPPTPTLTSTFTTHSPSAYDRTPVAVSPNTCALPGRHERELFVDNVPPPSHRRPSSTSHSSHSRRARAPSPKGSYFHPRAYEACAPEQFPSAAWSTSVSSPGHSSLPRFLCPHLFLIIPVTFLQTLRVPRRTVKSRRRQTTIWIQSCITMLCPCSMLRLPLSPHIHRHVIPVPR
ncbi:hypothetical protein SCLCIDRAFT_835809 [Scleroderma citrinum Foug A]|uniref:Uncharacterized protein n=1 Tax=Scleroderma citrinum Foug A TaxID=1036808 RepID=A0A0C3ABP7_9AGAM|nr:hypothetical protein SCLCIDRAFT_835809 [Scleroderma citrinum Foug A]